MVFFIFRKFSSLEVVQEKKTRFSHHHVMSDRIYQLSFDWNGIEPRL